MTTTDNGQHFAIRSKVAKKHLSFFREAGRGKALVQINNVVKFHPGIVALMGDEGSGRSRVLKQFADSLKNKPGVIGVLDGSLKNEEQLYGAIADELAIDHIPGENLKSLQKTVYGFFGEHTDNRQPVVIALDDAQRCSLAVLEALIALRTKYKTLSLILVGDNSLQKMLQRLQGGNVTMTAVQLAPLNTREIRQYMNWRTSLHPSESELAHIAQTTMGNIALLEQEVSRLENIERQKHSRQAGTRWEAIQWSRSATQALLLVVILAGATGAVFYFHQQQKFPVTDLVAKGQALFTDLLATVPEFGKKPMETTSPADSHPQNVSVTLRSNQEWTERQLALLIGDTQQSM